MAVKHYILLVITILASTKSFSQTTHNTVATGTWESTTMWNTSNGNWGTASISDGDIIQLNHNTSIKSNILTINPRVRVIVKEGITLMMEGKLKLNHEESVIELEAGAFITSPDADANNPSNNEKIWISNRTVWDTKSGTLPGPVVISYQGTTTPITLLAFSAKLQDKKVDLIWATASEQNFDYFVVERSYDARNYSPIGTVKGSGWSQTRKDYGMTDRNPLPGIGYYRLKAVDIDGYTEYFPPISVFNNNVHVTVSTTVQDYNLRIFSNIPASVQLVSLQGASILQEDIANGQNELALPNWLSKGVYVLIVSAESGVVKKERVVVR